MLTMRNMKERTVCIKYYKTVNLNSKSIINPITIHSKRKVRFEGIKHKISVLYIWLYQEMKNITVGVRLSRGQY